MIFDHRSALKTFNRTDTEKGNNTAGLLHHAHNTSQQPPTLNRLTVVSKGSSLLCKLSAESSHPAHHCTPISHEKKYLSPQHQVEGAEGKYISLCLPRPFPFQTWKLLDHIKLPEDTSDPVREEEGPATCLLHDQAAPRLHRWVARGRGKGRIGNTGQEALWDTRGLLPCQTLDLFPCGVSSSEYSEEEVPHSRFSTR